MIVKTLKMHCQGNDYIFLDLLEKSYPQTINWSKIACTLSDRHFGIGGDGLVLIEKSNLYDAKMRIFNTDGSEAEICGTALMCITDYLYHLKQVSSFKIEAMKSLHQSQIDLQTKNVTVLFEPIFFERMVSLTIDTYIIEGYLVNVGNLHLVLFANQILVEYKEIWQKIATHPDFPHGINIENVTIINNSELGIEIWERGSGFTLSCGSGSVASAYIAHFHRGLANNLQVNVPGGIVFVEVLNSSSCILQGKVSRVFETKIEI